MLMSRILQQVNDLLAGETLSYLEMRPHLDATIDDINQQLATVFPSFSDLDSPSSYEFFPDRYIRTVVCIGAAVRFYEMDEEGGQPPMGYLQRYRENLFFMLRDYLPQVPEEYIAPTHQGTVPLSLDGATHIGHGVRQGDFLP